jgi:hypothetical protein
LKEIPSIRKQKCLLGSDDRAAWYGFSNEQMKMRAKQHTCRTIETRDESPALVAFGKIFA